MADSDVKVAYYGNVKILRGFCDYCHRHSFIIDNQYQCCGREVKNKACGEKEPIYMSQPQPDRDKNRLSRKDKKLILKNQNNRCIYCGIEFGSVIKYGTGIVILRIHYDHFMSFAMTMNNSLDNFVAACHICNHIKHDKYFTTIEEASVYINKRRKETEVLENNLLSIEEMEDGKKKKQRTEMKKVICIVCGRKSYQGANSSGKFCSDQCRGKYKRQLKKNKPK